MSLMFLGTRKFSMASKYSLAGYGILSNLDPLKRHSLLGKLESVAIHHISSSLQTVASFHSAVTDQVVIHQSTFTLRRRTSRKKFLRTILSGAIELLKKHRRSKRLIHLGKNALI